MNNLTSFSNIQTMSSREIAFITGKMHKHVLVDCDKLNENYRKLSMDEISSVNYKAENGQFYREFLLTRMQTFDLMTGYDAELRIKVNRRWEELETKPNIQAIGRKELALMLLEAEEEKERLQRENEKLRPRSEFVDRVFNSEGLLPMSQVAKLLKLSYGRTTLYHILREKKVFFKNGRNNEPYQYYINKDYFRLKQNLFTKKDSPDIVSVQIFCTQKGLAFIAKLLNVVHIPQTQGRLDLVS